MWPDNLLMRPLNIICMHSQGENHAAVDWKSHTGVAPFNADDVTFAAAMFRLQAVCLVT
jgi:hypothetical protein